MKKLKKVLIIGSGAIRIGQAGEFDYSGSQCIKALKEEEIETILVNPNIATIQTSEHLADKIYFLPTDAYFVEKIIDKERPDGILLGFGGQTGLNTGIELSDMGVFEKYNIEVLGTPVEAIRNTEDRDLFVKKLGEINLKVPKSKAVNSVEEAIDAAEDVGYPVMCRIAYALGGLGSGVAYDKGQLFDIIKRAFSFTKQILVEEYLDGWKEIEYEVVRDSYDNCITVCNMENIDPMGIHTGESIVVAPSQTLTNTEYHKLREISIRVIRHLGIVGECNIQFALDPNSEDYRIIEVNARLSRSSALASKATGYPLAFIATKLALGYGLIEVQNAITKDTSACFEPSLDYVVLKVPRWDLQKFRGVIDVIGSEMKSVGEVMAIGRTYEEVLQKAIRMLGIDMNGIVCNKINFNNNIEEELKNPTDRRTFAVVEAMKRGYSIDKIHELSKIDEWFLHRMKNIVEMEKKLHEYNIDDIPHDVLLCAKMLGFSDLQIAVCLNSDESVVRKRRKELKIIPVVKQIDTLAGEFPAKTNYLYFTYNGNKDDIDFEEKDQVIVLGGGAYRIGSSVEFDWCCVNAVLTLRNLNYRTVMVNCNPETVSTDYDICDRLYFEELTLERILDIYEKENPIGIIISMGGQIPNNLVLPLYNNRVNILGTNPVNIDNAENRHKFSSLLDSLGVDQPEWKELTNFVDAGEFSKRVGYPVLVRPSYVLSGSAMSIVFNEKDLEFYLKKASDVSKEHPVVISKFITGAKEIEIDAVADKGELITYAINEHVENAGIHSGDATMVFPPQNVYVETMKRILDITKKIAEALEITGPFNIQFLAKENEIKVIECNLRASRSFPFVSKVSKINFSDLATKVIMGQKIGKKDAMSVNCVGVKAPQFSFSRLKGADPILTVEMTSTGEVACLGDDLNEAFLKSIISTGFYPPSKSVLVSVGGYKNKYKLLDSIKTLEYLGFEIYATEKTSEFLSEYGIKNIMVQKVSEDFSELNIINLLKNKKIDLVINIPKDFTKQELEDEYIIRRHSVDYAIPLLTNMELSELFIKTITKKSLNDLKIKAWDEY
ncbi:MAG: carbamoyl-phosphate synthase (glutamine-hydrolyzing) large subunit [Candidatus Aenigmatarchaeota archaeon]